MVKLLRVICLILFISNLAYAEEYRFTPEWVKSAGRSGITTDLNFSPDGRHLIYGCSNGSVKVWDIETGNQVAAYSDFLYLVKAYKKAILQPGINKVVFTGDSKKVIWSNWAHIIEQWDLESWKRDWELRSDNALMHFQFSPDEKIFAVSNINDIELYDSSNRKKIRSLKGHTQLVKDLSFSPDGKYIISTGDDATTRIWDVKSGKLISTLKGSFRFMEFSPDGKTYATAYFSGEISIRDFSSHKVVKKLVQGEYEQGEKSVNDMKFSRNGEKLFTVASDGIIRVWDVKNSRIIKEIDPYAKERESKKYFYLSEYFWKMALHPDEKILATGTNKGKVQLWDMESGEEIKKIDGHNEFVCSVKNSPDGKTIASASGDMTVKIWDSRNGKYLKNIFMKTVANGLCYSPDGKDIAAGGNTKIIYVFDMETWKIKLKLAGHSGAVARIVYSPDGKQIASSGVDKQVKIWDAQTGKELYSAKYKYTIFTIAYSPDGKTLAVGGEGKQITFIDTETGKQTGKLANKPNVIWLAYSPDGLNLTAGCTDSKIRIWDLNKKKLKYTLSGHKRSLATVIYSKDGSKLYSSGWDGALCVWDALKGKLLVKKDLTYNTIYELSIHPDGDKITFGSHDADIGVLEIK